MPNPPKQSINFSPYNPSQVEPLSFHSTTAALVETDFLYFSHPGLT